MGAIHTPELDAPPPAPALDDDELLTVSETARLLKVPVTWVYEHVRPEARDRLPVVRLGKYLRFHRGDLNAYLETKRLAATTPHRRR